MSENLQSESDHQDKPHIIYDKAPPSPIPNYTLSTVCPACGEETYRLACKVRCKRCGFMWDCSEL